MLYRLFTENKNYEQIKGLVCEYFDGATFIKAEGIWNGGTEHSLIIEIDTEFRAPLGRDNEDIENLVYVIKKLNKQEKILVQIIETNSQLI